MEAQSHSSRWVANSRSGVGETPVASSSAAPSVSPSPAVRSVSFSPVDARMLGMHVAGVQVGDWPGTRRTSSRPAHGIQMLTCPEEQ